MSHSLFAREDQFQYTRTETFNLQILDQLILSLAAEERSTITQADLQHRARAFVLRETRSWTSATRVGRIQFTELDVTFLAPHAPELWHVNGRPALTRGPQGIAPGGEHTYRVGNISLSKQELLEFPTDPQLICERLLATRPHDPAKVLTQLVESLRSGPKPAALRRGIHDALLLLENVRAAGTSTDRAGRDGSSLRFARDEERELELIFDAGSFELLGQRTRARAGLAERLEVPAKTLVEDMAITERAVTDEIPAA